MRDRKRRRRARRIVEADVVSRHVSLAGARIIAQGAAGPRLVELELAVDEALEGLQAALRDRRDGATPLELPEYTRFRRASRAFCEAAEREIEWDAGVVRLTSREGT